MDFSKILESLKLPPRYIIPITVIRGFLLFATPDLLYFFGLTSLIAQYRGYIGVGLIVSAGLLLSHICVLLYEHIQEGRKQATKLRVWQRRLHELTPEEKRLMNGYISGKTRSQYLRYHSGAVAGLALEGVTYQASPIGQLDRWPFNIQPWA